MAGASAEGAQASWKVSVEYGWTAHTVENYTLAMIHFKVALATAQGEDVLEVITYIVTTLIPAREFGEAKKFLAQFDEVRRVLDQGGMGGADNRETAYRYLLSQVEMEETSSAVGTASTPPSAGAKAGATSSAVGTASTPPSAGAKAGATSSAVGRAATSSAGGGSAGQPAGFWKCKACTTKFSQFTAMMFVAMAPRDPDEPVSCFFCSGLQ